MKSLPVLALQLLLMIIGAGCTKEEQLPFKKDYPVVITNSPLDLDKTGVTFSGTLLAGGTDPIRSYGFTWSWLSNAYRISWSGDLPEGEFTYRVSGDLPVGLPFIYQAFVETENHTVYGRTQSFTSLGDLPPRIVSFSPARGSAGIPVTLIADHISNSVEPLNRVFVQGREAVVLSVDGATNTIVFEIPEMEFTGNAELILQVRDSRVVAAQPFEVLGPVITGISKTEGYPGEELTINGTFYIRPDRDFTLFFGPYPATITKITENELTVIVPVISHSTLEDFSTELIMVNGQTTTTTEERFLVRKTWAQKTGPPFDWSWEYRAFTYEGKGYILEPNSKELHAYEPLTDQWTAVSSYPGISTDRNLFIVHDGKLLELQGNNYTTPFGQLWEYDFSTRQWREQGTLPFAFNEATSFQQDKIWYIITERQEVWTYDPENGSFSRKNDFPAAFNGFRFSFVLENEIMVVTYGTTWKYQAATDSWIVPSTNPLSRNDFSPHALGFVHQGAAYALENGVNLYKYQPNQGAWRLVSQFPDCSGYSSYKTAFAINERTYLVAFSSSAGGCSPSLFVFLN